MAKPTIHLLQREGQATFYWGTLTGEEEQTTKELLDQVQSLFLFVNDPVPLDDFGAFVDALTVAGVTVTPPSAPGRRLYTDAFTVATSGNPEQNAIIF